MDSATEQLMLARENPSDADANTAITLASAARAASYPFSFGTSTWNSLLGWCLTPRKTSSEPTICGIAFGDTKAPTSIVSRPAPTSASINAIRSATLTGVFSFCRPSRGPTSTMRTESLILISRSERLDLGEFDALAHDIADAAFYCLQHPRKRRAQGLLHFHDFKRQ